MPSAHIVLLRPRQGLSAEDRDRLFTALEHALVNIPMILRARVGRRVTLGRPYDAQNSQDFPYAAIIEFATEADLRAYLDHPAHSELGQVFFEVAEAALVYDFELVGAEQAHRLLDGGGPP
ncbi:MAG: Dabb family protein [Vicinamibacterales bacterium]